jgi:hypothetical protein
MSRFGSRPKTRKTEQMSYPFEWSKLVFQYNINIGPLYCLLHAGGTSKALLGNPSLNAVTSAVVKPSLKSISNHAGVLFVKHD